MANPKEKLMTRSPTPVRRPRLSVRLIVGAAITALAITGASVPAAAAPSTSGPSVVVTGGPTTAGPTLSSDTSYDDHRRVPPLVTRWAKAWNIAAADDLASLFTARAAYQDFAFGATFAGRPAIAEWVRITHRSIDNLNVEVDDAFRVGDRISVRWTFSGQIVGAPKPFSVPVSTVMEIRRGRISYDGDYYNLAEVLRQSGLPADTTF